MKVDAWSRTAVPLSLFCQSHEIALATGFFWTQLDRTYLISNWHNFSGREPSTGQPKNRLGAVPDTLTLKYHPDDGSSAVIEMSLPLTLGNSALWLQHHRYGQKVDVAVQDVTSCLHHFAQTSGRHVVPCCANRHGITSSVTGATPLPYSGKLKVSPGMDVFVLGYPLGIKGAGILPIWKRGSVASDYDFDYDGLPRFLIDTATREGMSGAPVFLRSFGMAIHESGEISFGGPVFTQFLGTYSGRSIRGTSEAHLGIVWKQILIEEIIASGTRGSYVLNGDSQQA